MHAYAIGAKADMATKNALPHEAEKFGRFVFTKRRCRAVFCHDFYFLDYGYWLFLLGVTAMLVKLVPVIISNHSVERDRPQAALVGSLRGFAATAAPHVKR